MYIWFGFIFGLLVGSFLNVVAHRFLTDQSIVQPASHCPHCNTPIRPVDNIPVISYVVLGGKCRQCKTGISLQYPLVELMTGLLFALVIWRFGLGWQTPFLLFLVSNLMVITVTDFKESLIFQINSLSLVPAGLIYNFFDLGHQATSTWSLGFLQIPDIFVSAIVGVIIAIIFFEGLILLSQVCFGTEGFGHGDTHLMMGVGAFVGWQYTLLALVLGFIFQAVPTFPVIIWQWIKEKDWVSLASGMGGIVFAFFPLWFMSMAIDPLLKSGLIFGSFGLAIAALFIFLRRLRDRETYTYMPLGPSLVLGSLVVLFWGNYLIAHYK